MGGPPAPDTTAPYLADLVTSLWAISTLGVVSRFALRARGYAGRLGLDDAVMALGWVLWTALWILTIIRFDTWGLGRPSDERWSDDLVVRLGKTTLVALELFTLSACAVRVSVLLFHRRLTADVTRYHRPIVAGIAFIIAWSLAVSIAFIFQCDPVEGFWMRLVSSWVEAHPNFQCYPEFPVSIVSAICALLSDLFAVIFPCWIVHKLANLSPRERIGLVLLFASGMLVSVARVFQVYYVTLFYLPQMRRTRSFEIFYGLTISSSIELALGMFLACLPTLHCMWRLFIRPYLRRFISGVGSHTHGNASSTSHHALSNHVASQDPPLRRRPSSSNPSDPFEKDDTHEMVHNVRDAPKTASPTPGPAPWPTYRAHVEGYDLEDPGTPTFFEDPTTAPR